MQKGMWQFGVRGLFCAVVVAAGMVTATFADDSTSQSAHYQVSELQFGSSDANQACSGAYCADGGVGGGIALGDGANNSTKAAFGQITSNDPLLEVIVDGGAYDLGEFSTAKPSVKEMSVKVRSYQSDGYMLQIIGSAPKHKRHTLKTLASPTTSQPGTEQFGINVVENTTPIIGKDPVQVPSGTFSFGEVTSNYNQTNKFMYHSGDVVARSVTESGETDYTISVLINVAGNTPAGRYTSDLSAVVIPLY